MQKKKIIIQIDLKIQRIACRSYFSFMFIWTKACVFAWLVYITQISFDLSSLPPNTPRQRPCTFHFAISGKSLFPLDLHHGEIIRNLTDVYKSWEAKMGVGTGDPFSPKLMTQLTLTGAREALLHLLPICLCFSAHQSNKSSIQWADHHEMWWVWAAWRNRRIRFSYSFIQLSAILKATCQHAKCIFCWCRSAVVATNDVFCLPQKK